MSLPRLLRALFAVLLLGMAAPALLAAGQARSDFNGDGRSDLLWRNAATGSLYLMPMNGTSALPGSILYTEPRAEWQIVAVDDFDGDGRPDLLWWNSATGQVCLMLMNGSAIRSQTMVYTEPNRAWRIVGTGDFTGDGKADILWRNGSTGAVYLMPMDGATVRPGAVIYTEPRLEWQIVAVADFDGDGRADLLWWNHATGQVFQMLMNGTSVKSQALVYAEPDLAWRIVGTGDFNGDGKADLLWRNTVSGAVYLMPMNGAAVLSGAVVRTEPKPEWQIVAIGDFNGDGRDDILWWNSATGSVFQMLMNGTAVLSAQTVYSEPDTAWTLQNRPGAPNGLALPVLSFQGGGHTFYGDWSATVQADQALWSPGQQVRLRVDLLLPDSYPAALAAAGLPLDAVLTLVTAERTFDADGWLRLPSDEKMSTLLTPAGLAIEGGIQGAVTSRYGYPFKAPVDVLQELAPAAMTSLGSQRQARFLVTTQLPADLPPGLYRLRFDFGLKSKGKTYNLNGYNFAARPFSPEAGTITYFYSPCFPASGTHASGRKVDATQIQARTAWTLLANYNSNGYQGVVASEDQGRFALSNRIIIPDEVVLPRYDSSNKALSYSLEPTFAADIIDAYSNLAWDFSRGELNLEITAPDGTRTVHLHQPIIAKSGNGPTTRNSAFTAWKPTQYGLHSVKLTGWIQDASGRRFEGGGTYSFWIAKRLTMATATFQGMPYPVGTKYGRDIAFNPPVAAEVEMTATLYPDSDPAQSRSLASSGKATAGGIFGVAQGMKQFTLDAAGEYHGKVFAKYTDPDGHLWVCVMRHAGIVYRDDAPILARGKKLYIKGQYLERGDTNFEGWVDPDGTTHLQHITYPYNSGDVLLIAAEGQGANKIEPVLLVETKGQPITFNSDLLAVGKSNLSIKTANGYSPHLYPEYITDRQYYYGAAPRPGFMSRFLVGESTVRAPYWPVSPNAFGGQIAASANGDTPGDIYRLLGGVVLRPKGAGPTYAGYLSSAFLLPKGTGNNRVVAAGSEDLNGSTGDKARFFLVGFRPGMALELGASWRPGFQIDPILPVTMNVVLTYPDGRQETCSGVGDAYGSFSGPVAYTLDQPGIYHYQATGSWNGFTGRMPGLPDSGGMFFVFPKDRPASSLSLDLPSTTTFPASGSLTVTGSSTADKVTYALIMPGAVLGQGELPVTGGKFQILLDPVALNKLAPIYDIRSVTSGAAQIGRVLHLSLFAQEKAADGSRYWDFKRLVVRGTTAVWAK
jgi:hypothetical protein